MTDPSVTVQALPIWQKCHCGKVPFSSGALKDPDGCQKQTEAASDEGKGGGLRSAKVSGGGETEVGSNQGVKFLHSLPSRRCGSRGRSLVKTRNLGKLLKSLQAVTSRRRQASSLKEFCENALKYEGVACQVIGRTMAVDSIQKSLDRREKACGEQNQFKSFSDIFNEIHDLVGPRIALDPCEERKKHSTLCWRGSSLW